MPGRWSFRLLQYSIVFLALFLVLLLGLKYSVGRPHTATEQPRLPQRIESAISLLLNQKTLPDKIQGHGQACSLASTANATLGFESVLALSKGGRSWRRQGLMAAAKLTNIDVKFPPQPMWSKELADAFEALGDGTTKKPPHGSALAWLAHIDLLKFIIQSELSTALVLEDDADWDVNIKKQMRLIATAVRAHTDAAADDLAPYSQNWDVLWIGHCGDSPRPAERLTTFADNTTVPHAAYKGWAKGILQRVGDGERAVYAGHGPVCTFAYAVTAAGARRVLAYVAAGQEEAFDIKLMRGCEADVFRCLVVNPEVVRHFRPDARFGPSSDVGAANKHKEDAAPLATEDPSADTSVRLEYDVAMNITGTTENILESARCRSLWGISCMPK